MSINTGSLIGQMGTGKFNLRERGLRGSFVGVIYRELWGLFLYTGVLVVSCVMWSGVLG